MPGTSLKVFPTSNIACEKGRTAVVILAWQYFEQIYLKLRNSGFKGEIVRPILP